MSDPILLRAMHARLSDMLADVEDMWKQPVKVTLCVRNPAYPNGARDLVISNEDDTREAAAAITRNAVDNSVTITGRAATSSPSVKP